MRFRVGHDGLEARLAPRRRCGVRVLREPRRGRGRVAGVPRQPRQGFPPVSAGAAGLLVVGFERGRQAQVGDEPDIGLVDAHAEGGGRGHDAGPSRQEGVLRAVSLPLRQARVVAGGREARPRQRRGGSLGLAPGPAIGQGRLAGRASGKEREERLHRAPLDHGVEPDVRAVEPAGDHRRAWGQETPGHLVPDLGGGRGRERDPGTAGERRQRVRNGEVVGAEGMAPLADAVRLVDGDEGEEAGSAQRGEAPRPQPLRRDVDEVELAGGEGLLRLPPFPGAHHALADQGRGPDPAAAKRVALVPHERDERRDDEGGPGERHGRDLVGHRFPAARRHQGEDVPAAHGLRDRLGLDPPETWVAEDAGEHVQGRGALRRMGRARKRRRMEADGHGTVMRPPRTRRKARFGGQAVSPQTSAALAPRGCAGPSAVLGISLTLACKKKGTNLEGTLHDASIW